MAIIDNFEMKKSWWWPKDFAFQHHCQLHTRFVAGGTVFISMLGPFQCLLSGAGHAIFGLNVYLLCRDGNRKISFLFASLMKQVIREFRRNTFHSIPSQYTSRRKETACFIFFFNHSFLYYHLMGLITILANNFPWLLLWICFLFSLKEDIIVRSSKIP